MDTVCFAQDNTSGPCIQQAQTSNMYTYHEHLVVIRMIFENIGVLEPIRLLIPSSMPHGPRGKSFIRVSRGWVEESLRATSDRKDQDR